MFALMKNVTFLWVLVATLFIQTLAYAQLKMMEPASIYYQQTINSTGSQTFKRKVFFSPPTSSVWSLHFQSQEPLEDTLSPDSAVERTTKNSVYFYTITPVQHPADSIELRSAKAIAIGSMFIEQDKIRYPIKFIQLEETQRPLSIPSLNDLIKASLPLTKIEPDKDCWCEPEHSPTPPPDTDPAPVQTEMLSQKIYSNLLFPQTTRPIIYGDSIALRSQPAEQSTPRPLRVPLPIENNQYLCLTNQCPEGRQNMGNNDGEQEPPEQPGFCCSNFSCIKIKNVEYNYQSPGGNTKGSQTQTDGDGDGDTPPPGDGGGPLGTNSLSYMIAKNRILIAPAVGAAIGAIIQEAVMGFVCASLTTRNKGENWWDCVTRLTSSQTTAVSACSGGLVGLAVLVCLNSKRCYCKKRQARKSHSESRNRSPSQSIIMLDVQIGT